ncbi:MAG: uroporphyrinogen decarboxylase family protein [Anaerolineae bacterium]|nr:uroporphyrinogen decarboxylase family protein [Anaerolineae bacterium]
MTPLQRVLTTLGHQEPDRVPMFLLLTMHGAKELGLSIREYFSSADNVVEGQVRMQKKYHNDCFYNFFYASIEVEAFGGQTIFRDDGPPNAAEPVIQKREDILKLQVPDLAKAPGIQQVLAAHRLLKDHAAGEIPIIGVVMSPFSLPVMQMGFEAYFDLIYEAPELFQRLMAVNEAFCVAWANAQLEAGATAICFFDPVSSQTMITPEQYRTLSQPIAKRTIARIQGPTATHFASGRCLSIVDDVADTGTAIIGISADESPAELKAKSNKRLSLLGNLNGIEMRRWTAQDAEAAVKAIIADAGAGGGLILSDNHGEIPFQVESETLQAVSAAVQEWGRYPLKWSR